MGQACFRGKHKSVLVSANLWFFFPLPFYFLTWEIRRQKNISTVITFNQFVLQENLEIFEKQVNKNLGRASIHNETNDIWYLCEINSER